jgi:hypothetical protein
MMVYAGRCAGENRGAGKELAKARNATQQIDK